jgi:phospholipid/cholesterol/gamma-HCH transport system substrate-binding protein
METRANYALIGAFTLAILFAAFGFVFWFSGPSKVGRHKIYQIEFPGAVTGLAAGSSVLFNGLKVGEVTRLQISREDPSRVDVLVSVDDRTPVKTNTKARLETRGFTGVADLLLVGGTRGAPELTVSEGKEFPEIQAERSDMQNLMGNAQQLSTKAAEVLLKFDRFLDQNAEPLGETIKNARNFSKALSDNSQNVSNTLQDVAEIARQMKPVVARLDRFLATGEQSLKAIDPAKLKRITSDMASLAANLDKFSASGLKQYEALAIDGRKAINTLDRTLRSIERDPSQFIFGPSQAQTTPEYKAP